MTETSIRPYQPQDNEAIHSVVTMAAEHDRVDPISTLESVPTLEELVESLETNRSNPNTDVFVAVDDTTGNIVGYGKVGWWREEDGTFLYLHQGTVNPDHRNKGIGTQLLTQLQSRIRQIADTHPADAPKVFGARVTETEHDTLKLLGKDGYQQVWSSLEMEHTDPAAIEDIAMPEGFELRPVVIDEEKRKVYEANVRLYECTWGAVPASEEDYQDFLKQNDDTSLWQVAWDGDNVAGFVLSNIDEAKGEVTQVGVVAEYRRRGLGQALMAENIRALYDRGLDVIRLHTDADGKMGGRQLYDSLGFSALKESYRFRKPL